MLNCHKIRGFCDTWCSWIYQILHGGSVAVKINDEMGPYFQSAKGVRQGDPLAPFLFNMIGECLTKMVLRAQANGLFEGLASDLVENGIAILQYADDTVICISHDPEKAVNVKLLLYLFELMSGLKINFLKSEVFTIGADNDITKFYAEMFNCQVGVLPMKYLGMPVTFSNLKNIDWDFLDMKFIKKLDAWICGSASSGARLTLLQSCLSGLPSYYMSMFLLNKTFIEKIYKHMRRFFWQGVQKKRKYYMVKWRRICRSRSKGGLGVKDLRKQNISLLVKWWWRLETQDGLLQRIVRAKYLQNQSVALVSAKFNDSPAWKNILKVKDVYMKGRKIILKCGNLVRFWKDSWLDNKPLMELFPVLYNICMEQEITFRDCLMKNCELTFRRRLLPEYMTQWGAIQEKARGVNLVDDADQVIWDLCHNKKFSTKSVYKLLEKTVVGPNYKWLWKTKVPLKIRIFLWQLVQDAVPTRENMKKRKWLGNPCCSFCDQMETSNHLFFSCTTAKSVWGIVGAVLKTETCPKNFWQCFSWFYAFWPGGGKFYPLMIAAVCWSLWTTRNKMTFDKYKLRNPISIVFTACAFLTYWAGLYSGDDKEAITGGAAQLKKMAMLYVERGSASQTDAGLLRLTDGYSGEGAGNADPDRDRVC